LARLFVWLFGVLLVVQLTLGGWSRMRAWLSAKFIGVPAAAAGATH
jgi:hypothetical protein